MASPPVPGQKVAVDGCLMARLPQVLHTPENQPETRRLWKASGSLHYCVTRRVLLASGESINKREDNMARDKRVTRQLRQHGWKVIRIWQLPSVVYAALRYQLAAAATYLRLCLRFSTPFPE